MVNVSCFGCPTSDESEDELPGPSSLSLSSFSMSFDNPATMIDVMHSCMYACLPGMEMDPYLKISRMRSSLGTCGLLIMHGNFKKHVIHENYMHAKCLSDPGKLVQQLLDHTGLQFAFCTLDHVCMYAR